MKKRWSQHDIELLKLHYKSLDYKDLGALMGRKKDAVAHKCRSLGLVKACRRLLDFANANDLPILERKWKWN